MTHEDKNLLLKDLCARLPYSIWGLHRGEDLPLYAINNSGSYMVFGYDAWFNLDTIPFKPYLRPVASMTEKEIDTLFIILNIDKSGKDDDWIKINDVLGIKFFFPTGKWIDFVADALDYLNTIHVDYLGLIEMELALEAPENMYKTE